MSNSIEDREGGKQVTYYQVDLTLTDIETNEKIWLGPKKIKKFIERKRAGIYSACRYTFLTPQECRSGELAFCLKHRDCRIFFVVMYSFAIVS